MVSFRLLITGVPASDTQDELNEEEAQKQQTFARLKALLQFYQESGVKRNYFNSRLLFYYKRPGLTQYPDFWLCAVC